MGRPHPTANGLPLMIAIIGGETRRFRPLVDIYREFGRRAGHAPDKLKVGVHALGYPLAIALCFVTMLCWGSWANTQKLASNEWRFQLFYWDFAIGVFLWALLLAFTLGSGGAGGRIFMTDLRQADIQWLGSGFLGGLMVNLSNILLVAAIDIAGMGVAFLVGVGLALVLGVITTYLSTGSAMCPC
jgi:hypothetical protein